MKIAICGAGIAGGTLACWLLKAGHEPFFVERAPALRRLRSRASRLTALPGMARLMLGAVVRDDLALPEYG